MKREHVKEHIELAIDRARDGLGESIDEIDRKLRGTLDFSRVAGEHAPKLMAAGLGVGFLLGFRAPRFALRTVQVALPLFIAFSVAKKQMAAKKSEG